MPLPDEKGSPRKAAERDESSIARLPEGFPGRGAGDKGWLGPVFSDQNCASSTEPVPEMPMAWAEARERSMTRPWA